MSERMIPSHRDGTRRSAERSRTWIRPSEGGFARYSGSPRSVPRSADGPPCRRAPGAESLNGGPIDPAVGWGPETVEGKRCMVKVEAYKDSKGETRTKVTEIKPIERNPEEEADFSDISS